MTTYETAPIQGSDGSIRVPVATRIFPWGFIAVIPPGETVELKEGSQLMCRPLRIMFDPKNAEHFLLIEMNIGMLPQLMGRQGIRGTMFPIIPENTECEPILNFDTINVGQNLSFYVKNTSDKSLECSIRVDTLCAVMPR